MASERKVTIADPYNVVRLLVRLGSTFDDIAGLGFYLHVVVGLPQTPESGYRDAHMSARHDVGTRMKAILSVC